MADMPDTTPEHATTRGPGGCWLRSSVCRDRLPDFVPRPRLLDRLDEALMRELTWFAPLPGPVRPPSWPIGSTRRTARRMAVAGRR